MLAHATRRPATRRPSALEWIEAPRRLHRRRRGLGPRYNRLLAATGVSSLGDGLVAVALPLLAASLTRSPFAIGAVLACLRLPWLFFALPLGAVADRTDRRRMATSTEAARCALLIACGVAIAAGAHSLLFVYGLAFLMGTCETAFVAATSSAIPDLVPREQFARANGRLFAVNTATDDFLGVAIGGLLFAAVAALPFLLDGVSFAASGLLLLAALPRRADAEQPAVRTDLRRHVSEGIKVLVGDAGMRTLLAANASLALLQATVIAILVAFGLGTLHMSRAQYGAMLALAAGGAVVGGSLAGKIADRIGNVTMLPVAGLGAAAGYCLLAAAHSFAVAVVALAVEGFAVVLGRAALMAMRQERVPSDMQARTGTAFRAVVYGVVPLGALLGGAVASLTSLRAAILLAGVVQVGVALAIIRPLRRDVPVDVDGEVDLRDTIDLSERIDLTDPSVEVAEGA